MTNFEYIKSATKQQLINFYCENIGCRLCKFYDGCGVDGNGFQKWLDRDLEIIPWLTFGDLINRGVRIEHNVDQIKVGELMESMEENGYEGVPMLIYGNRIIAGNHRFSALESLYTNYIFDLEEPAIDPMDWYVAYDVYDIVNTKLREMGIDEPDFDLDVAMFTDNLRVLFTGTKIESLYNGTEEW